MTSKPNKPSKIDKAIAKERIQNEEDFIFSEKYGYSLKRMMAQTPGGLDNEKIAKVLLMTPEEVEEEFLMAIAKIKKALKI